MKQTKEDALIAEAYQGNNFNVPAIMERVMSDLETLERVVNDPNTPEDKKAKIMSFFYTVKDYPI